MAGNAENVKLGVCSVSFGGSDMGYTQGGVSVTYKAETTEVNVDQEDVPIDEVVQKQSFEVKVPLAESDLTRLAEMIPGASLVTDSLVPTKQKLVMSGSAGVSLMDMAHELILAPVGEGANSKITLHHAVPVPSIEFSYQKDKVRVYEVTFKAMKGINGWVTMGDTSATP